LSLGGCIFIPDETIATFFSGLAFDNEQMFEIFKQLHLLRVVFGVVLNVLLMSLEVFDNIFLLSEFGAKEFTVAFEFISKSLIRLSQEFTLVRDSL